ncbi:MAG: acyltransferase family protein [Cyanobacteria bacterium J06650_10]
MSKLSYRPDIDGLRAIAVIPVILFHLDVPWMAGGYLGVDVFFVISGFLITYIVQSELEAGTFSFKSFFRRRVSRILPALLVTIIATLLVSLSIAFAPDLQKIGTEALSATFSYANLSMLLKDRDYWSQAAESSPFLHAWSLSVEEQFYLFYPGILLLFSKGKRKNTLAITSLFLISFVLFLIGLRYYPISTFYALPTRIWELTTGGLIAVAMKSRSVKKHAEPSNTSQSSKHLARVSLFSGLSLIIFSYFQQSNTGAVSSIVLLPVIGTSLIIYFGENLRKEFGENDAFVTRLLSYPALTFIGKLSYAAYLVHWPVIVLMTVHDIKTDTHTSAYTLLLVMLGLTLLLHIWVEKPTRKMQNIYPLVVSLIVVVATLSIYLIGFASNRLYADNFAPPTFYGLYYDVSATIGATSRDNQRLVNGVLAPTRETRYTNAYSQNGIVDGALSSEYPELLVIGDSHGSMWAKTIAEIAEESKFSVSFFTTVSNNPLFDIPLIAKPEATRRFSQTEKLIFNQNILDKIELWRPRAVIVSMRWVGNGEKDLNRVEELIQYCAARGVDTILIEQPPEIRIGNHNSAQFLSYLDITAEKDKNQYVKRSTAFDVVSSNKRLAAIAQKYNSASLFKTFEQFSPQANVLVAVDDEILYFDDDHLSYEGTSLLKSQLKRMISNL